MVILAFRNAGAGAVMSRLVQGRRVISSLVKRRGSFGDDGFSDGEDDFDYGHDGLTYGGFGEPSRPPSRVIDDWRIIQPQDPFGRPRPRPIVMETIECINGLSDSEKFKFGYIFSQLLGLPKPPELPAEGKFAVKLVTFNPEKKQQVLYEVAWAMSMSNVKVIKDLAQLGVAPPVHAMENVPCVIKQGISEEEANEIIAKVKAVGGVAVMEVMEPLE